MKKSSVKIGVTLGDPAGVGPEVAFRAVNSIDLTDAVPVIIGRSEVIKKHYPGFLDGYIITDSFQNLSDDLSPGKKYFFNIDSDMPVPVPGNGSRETGLESRSYIDTAVEMWKSGAVDALVTGPVSKGFVDCPECRFAGHTEYIAGLIGEENPYMMMFSGDYRVVLVTTHVPVADVTGLIDTEKILGTVRAADAALRNIDGRGAKLAIAGLDPHCGDSGAIGSFDQDVTAKAVVHARGEGIDIEGPFAADTVFITDRWRSYSAVIALYHDQGLIPFKMIAFDSGVNVTLGLSIVRTSPDHGTAYDIAGKGIANHTSMLEAVKLAYSLTQKKNKK